jgi:RNA polymerase sigma-54 factor
MKVNLGQKLSSQLTLTPQLKQAIRLLQMSALEMEQELIQAADENPFLDFDNSLNEEYADPIMELSHHAAPTKLQMADTDDMEEYSTLSKEESLLEFLTHQISTVRADADVIRVLYFLAGCVDEKGYLRESLDDLRSSLDQLDLDTDPLERGILFSEALSLLKKLDPPGVGALDLRDCLQIQLDQLQNIDSAVRQVAGDIITHGLEELGKYNLDKLKQKVKCKEALMTQAITLIKSLNPAPGLQYASDPGQIVTPDVFIKKINRRWTVLLNPNNQPNIKLRTEYVEAAKEVENTPENQPFLEKLNEAKVLIRSVKQRSDTILRVAQAIVEKQQGFFEHGDLAMQPLLLKEIAETVSLHESTISRVTNQKYLQSSRGTYSFKYFFGGQITREAGATVSAKAIQTLIKQLIQNESAEKPLSDGDISTLLNNEGYQIARRTIVKYREILKVPAAHARKKIERNL